MPVADFSLNGKVALVIGGDEYIDRPSSVGRQSPALVSIEIRDNEGKVLGPNEEEIQAYVRSNLASYKVPSYILFVDEPLPRIASGKFDKRALQKRAIDWLQQSAT